MQTATHDSHATDDHHGHAPAPKKKAKPGNPYCVTVEIPITMRHIRELPQTTAAIEKEIEPIMGRKPSNNNAHLYELTLRYLFQGDEKEQMEKAVEELKSRPTWTVHVLELRYN